MDDSIDLSALVSALRRGRRWILAGVLIGVGGAVVVTRFLEPQYEAKATVVLRASAGAPRPELTGLIGVTEFFSSRSGFDTDLEVLKSRAVTGEVVDSLGLQARLLRPEGVSAESVFSPMRFDRVLERGVYRFERHDTRFQVTGPSGRGWATPGGRYQVKGAELSLRSQGLPDAFEVELVDYEDAINRLQEDLEVERASGDVAELTFRASARTTAAAVPNAMIAKYLARQKTIDRSVNQYRLEFLTAHTDTVAKQLAAAERALRSYREEIASFHPVFRGEKELEQALRMEAEFESLEIESRALQQILTESKAGTLSVRNLAAYPTFLRNAAINDLLSRLLALEAQRSEFLQRRTGRDPDVLLLEEQIGYLENQLVSLSQAYLESVRRQQSEIREELEEYTAALDLLPARAEESARLEREVERLSKTYIALQTELVQGRLAAIAEGGDVRQIDTAVPPERPVFPKPFLNLLIGLLGGLLLGMVGALGDAYLGRRVRDARQAELAAGVPAIYFEPAAPLLVGGINRHPTLLVIPVGLDARAGPVARRIAGTAALQGKEVVLFDLEETPTPSRLLGRGGRAEVAVPAGADDLDLEALEQVESVGGSFRVYPGNNRGAEGAGDARSSAEIRRILGELEGQFSFVVVALPGLHQPMAAAVLDGDRPVVITVRMGKTTRGELEEVVTVLGRAGVHVAGVILCDEDASGDRRA